jgi:hypothetical protein
MGGAPSRSKLNGNKKKRRGGRGGLQCIVVGRRGKGCHGSFGVSRRGWEKTRLARRLLIKILCKATPTVSLFLITF